MFNLTRIAVPVLVLTLPGCGEDAQTNPTLDSAAVLVSSTATRPFGGVCRTVIAFLEPEEGQPANVQHIRVDLDCNLAHLGRTSGVLFQTITSTGLSTTLVATAVYTAANGDELHSVFAGNGLIDPIAGSVAFSGIETYAGGTGRLAGASGASDLAGSASLQTLAGRYELTNGSLTY